MERETIEEKLFTDGKYDRRRSRSCPDFILKIQELAGKCASNTEAVYRIYYGAVPNECKTCQKPTKFISWTKGYADFCSAKCMQSHPGVKQKRVKSIEKTCLEKYGCSNPLGNEAIRHKATNTIISRYGVDNISKSQSFKSKVTKTSKQRYGTEHPLQSSEVKSKISSTMISRYGAKTTLESAMLADKVRTTMMSRYGAATTWHSPVLFHKLYESNKKRYIERCKSFLNDVSYNDDGVTGTHSCGASITFEYFDQLKCQSCKTSSRPEQELFEYVQSLGVECRRNDRMILKGKELDLWLPQHSLGIEMNGAYWHHSHSDKIPLADKTRLAEDAGGRLLHVWDFEWEHKRDIVKNLICAALKMFDRRIYARSTTVKQITANESKPFLQKYHLHGSANAKHHIGIFDNCTSDLIGVMTLSQPRFKEQTADLEIVRLCFLPGLQIIGGLSKLSKFALKSTGAKTLCSYVDKRISTAAGFVGAGFTIIGESKPGYCWFSKKIGILKRHQTTKKELAKLLNADLTNKTEDAVMREMGFLKLVDSGNFKVTFAAKA